MKKKGEIIAMSGITEKSLDLCNIPKHRNGNCDWANMRIVTDVPFTYGNTKGVLKIIGISMKPASSHWELEVQYGNLAPKKILSHALVAGKIAGIIGAFTKDHKYSIGDRLKDEKRDITIIDVFRIENKGKYVSYICNKCSYIEGFATEIAMDRGTGCNVCSGKKLVVGKNDIATTAPELIPYLCGGIEEAKKHTKASHDKVLVKCPFCDTTTNKLMSINALYKSRSVGCPCRGGISLPDRFLLLLMRLLIGERYIPQLTSKHLAWVGRYRYDGAILSNSGKISKIIEIHGMQHYKPTVFGRGSLSYEKIKKNDEDKYCLALENGLDKNDYIVIDARYSTLKHMKNSILNSHLLQTCEADLTKIDWEGVYLQALTPVDKEIIDYATANPFMRTEEIAIVKGVSQGKVARVLSEHNLLENLEKRQRYNKISYKQKHDERLVLLDKISNIIKDNPHLSIQQIADALGVSRYLVDSTLKKSKHEIDVEQLHKNGRTIQGEKVRKCFSVEVWVTSPDKHTYYFPSIQKLTQEARQVFNRSFAKKTISEKLKSGEDYKGYTFWSE